MIDLARLMNWTGLNQARFAAKAGVDQGGLSKILAGDSTPSAKLLLQLIERSTPTVLFINHSPHTHIIANAMINANQLDVLEHNPDAFDTALKSGLMTGVITDNKEPFLALIDSAIAESGLPAIPTSGIWINEDGTVNEWKD